jgi:hypothetical protein
MPTFGTSVQALTVTPYIIDSSQITGEVNFDGGAGLAPDGGAEDTCTALIGGHGKGTGDTPAGLLTPGVQYWQLPDIASGSLQDTKTYILALTGCLPGFQLTATELTLAGAATEEGHAVSPTPASVCGASFDGGSNNLAISVSQLDTTTVIGGGSDAGIGIQFANVSTALQGNPFLFPIESGGTLLEVIVHPPASDGLLPGIPGESVIVTDGGELEDGAANPITNIIPTFNPIAATPSTVATSGTLPAAVEVSGLPILNSDGGAGPVAFAAATLPGTDDGGISPLPYPVYVVGSTPTLGDLFEIPFSDIFALSAWSASTPAGGTPAYFLPGQTYTFVVMGSNDVGIPQLVNPDGTPNTTTYDGRGLHIVAFPNTFTPSQAP